MNMESWHYEPWLAPVCSDMRGFAGSGSGTIYVFAKKCTK